MAKNKKTKPTKADVGIEASPAHTGFVGAFGLGGQLFNPDSIPIAKGGGLSVYDIVARDDQVKSVWTQRVARITSAELVIEPGGKRAIDKAAADNLRENLESIDFDKISKLMLYGIFYGYAVAEVMWMADGAKIAIKDILTRDRERFTFDKDYNLLWQDGSGGAPKPMPDQKFWVYSAGADNADNPYGLGLAHWLYWPVFFKRGGQQSWLKFLDKYGTPTAKGTFPASATTAEKTKLLEALGAISTDAGIIVPEGMQVELIEATRAGSATYSELYDRMNNAISKVVLTQTMTTDDGSSLSQAAIHADAASLVAKDDADTLSQSFNNSVARWLCQWNFPGAAAPKMWRKIEKDPTTAEHIEIDKGLFDIGYQATEAHIKDVYGDGYEKRAEPVIVSPESPEGEPEPGQDSDFADPATNGPPQDRRGMAALGAIDGAAIDLAERMVPVIDSQLNTVLDILQSGDIKLAIKRVNQMIKTNAPPDGMQAIIAQGEAGARLLSMENAGKDGAE